MIVKDEERFLPGCLASVRGVVDEINVVDTGSTDRTVEIARSYGARVISRPWREDFAWARNESLAMATRRWTLILDADEEITAESLMSLRRLGTDEPADTALFVRIVNNVEDEAGIATFSHVLPRIFPTSPRIRYHGAIHEALKIDDTMMSGRLSDVEILHHGYTTATTKTREKAARNMPLLRRELAEKGSDPFALFNFGFNAIQQHPDLLDEGIEALEAMTRLGTDEPFLTIGISALATAYSRRKGNCERALQLVELAEERLPPDADILFTHGTVLNMLGRFDEGRALWQRLLNFPDNLRRRALVDDEIFRWKAAFNIAHSYIAEGRLSESLPWFERALKSKPDSTFILIRYAAALEQAGAHLEAESQFRRWAELDPAQGALELIHFLIRQERLREAVEFLAGSAHLLPGEAVEAANEALRAAELAGECRSAADFFHRSNRLLELGRNAEAATAAGRAVELDPTHSAAAYSRALATLNMGNETEAALLFDLVPDGDRKIFGSAMAARAHLLDERGDLAAAVTTLTRWIEVLSR
jgi:glycosyltransferase involved in cell wall biosynthesis